MKCKKCKFENEKGAKYCIKCGSRLKKKSTVKKTVKILLLIVLLLLLTGILVPVLTGLFTGAFKGEDLVVYEKPDTGMVLYANRSTFYAGEKQELVLTARITGTVSENASCQIQDADGKILAAFEASEMELLADYREYSCSVPVEEPKPVSYEYSVTDGETSSLPLRIQFIEPLTMEAMKRCAQIGQELSGYVEENELEQKKDAVCLENVYEWLEKDARVLEAEINGNSVLYISQDHVAGIYTLPPEKGQFGADGNSTDFSQSAKTVEGLKAYLESGTLPADDTGNLFYIDGKQSVTNTSWLLAGANVENDNDTSVADSHRYHLSYFVKLRDEKVPEMSDANGSMDDNGNAYIASLVEKDLIHFGVITTISHGSFIRKSNGDYISLYLMYDWERDAGNFETAISEMGLARNEDLFDYFYAENLEEAKNGAGFFLSGTVMCITSNAYKRIYQNCFFDNTILYFGSCFGMLDHELSQFLLDHGARMTMGYEASCQQSMESVRFAEKFNELYETDIVVDLKALDFMRTKFTHASGDVMNYVVSYWGKLVENGANIWATLFDKDQVSTKEVAYEDNLPDWVPEFLKISSGRRDDLPDAFRTFHLKQYSDYENVRAVSHGALSGTVTTQRTQISYDEADNQTVNTLQAAPVRDVTLDFYQFLNQGFADANTHALTQEDGTFSLKNLRWGVYGIRLTGEAIADTMAGVTFTEKTFDGGTIEAAPWGASYTGSLVKKNPGRGDGPVANASVTFSLMECTLAEDRELTGTVYTAVTDAQGHFIVNQLPGGVYTITFTTADGKSSMTRNATLENGVDYTYARIYLEEVSYYPFIHDQLLPQLGMVPADSAYKTLVPSQMTNGIAEVIGWSGKEGLLGADITDFNQDGTEDLLLYSIENRGLFVSVYSMDAEKNVYLITKEKLADLQDIGYQRCKVGLMDLSGKQYLYIETDENAYFANGGGTSYMWYYLTADGKLRPRWKIGKTCGGSSCIANSLRDYYAEGEGTILTLCTDGELRDLGKEQNYQGPSCEEYVLTADGEHRYTWPDEQVLQQDERTLDSGIAFKTAFAIIGLTRTAEYSSDNYYDAQFGVLPTLWGTAYVKESVSYESRGTKTDNSGRNMSVSTDDCTGLYRKMEELDQKVTNF